MSESHSMMLVKRAIEDVQRYLEVQAKGELLTVPALPDGRGIALAHRLNQVLRQMNLHVSRATVHDEAMREARRGYNAIVKNVALGPFCSLRRILPSSTRCTTLCLTRIRGEHSTGSSRIASPSRSWGRTQMRSFQAS